MTTSHHHGTPATTARKFGKYLVAFDFSDESKEALREAHNLAAAHGAELHVVNVEPVITAPHVAAGPVFASTANAAPAVPSHEEDLERLTEIKAAIGEEGVSHCTVHVRRGNPGDEITALAAMLPATVVVVGTKPKSGVERFFFGSVAEKVMREAPCPVLVARKQERTYPEIEPPNPGTSPSLGKRHTYKQRSRNAEARINPPLVVPQDNA